MYFDEKKGMFFFLDWHPVGESSRLLQHDKDLNTFLIFEFKFLFFVPCKKVQNCNHDSNIKLCKNSKI